MSPLVEGKHRDRGREYLSPGTLLDVWEPTVMLGMIIVDGHVPLYHYRQ